MKNIITQALKLGLWRPLDIQFANMLALSLSSESSKHKQYKKKALILASISLSAGVGYGHTCLPLNMLAPDKLFQGNHLKLAYAAYKKSGKLSTENWEELLFSMSAVSDGSHLSPLILENQCLYFHRMWQDECIIAKFFNSTKNWNPFQEEKIIKTLNQLFSKKSEDIDWAKIATAISLIKQKTFITGGPGTGKTFIIAKIIAAFLLLYHQNHDLNIKMTAPTGKAAAHLTESFNIKINNIIKSNNQNKYIFPKKATTIHNLLGSRLYTKHTQYNRFLTNPLHLDLLIIDEASMMSSSILAQLILALPTNAKIIFLGDHNQLCSVMPGSVFKDICQHKKSNYYSSAQNQKIKELTGYVLPTPDKFILSTKKNNHNNIIDNICILKKNFRFNKNSGIHQLSNAINLGNFNHALSILTSNIYIDVLYIRHKEKKDYINMITNCAVKYCNYLKILQNTSTSIIDILKIFNQYRILCAVHDGPFGIIKINYYIEKILHQKGLIQLHKSPNYIGRPIIILKNAPSLGLFNGDIGMLLLNSKEKLSAYFLNPPNIIKIIPIHQLPQHDTCFAITIHKSQGSEFQNISIILPNQHTSILTRELFYTAVTRASQNLILYAIDHVIIQSINLVTKRHSGLFNKIKNI